MKKLSGWLKLGAQLGLMLLWTAIVLIGSELIVGWIMIAILGTESFQETLPTTIYSIISYLLAVILIILVPELITRKRQPTKDKTTKKSERRLTLGIRGLPTWTDIGLAIIGFVVALLLGMGLTNLFGLFPWFNADETQNIGYEFITGGVERIAAFIGLVVIAPITEELIFRGWLYGKMREKSSEKLSNFASIALSALLVSVLFGAVHMQWNVGVVVFAMSLTNCALREITGTIYAGTLVHMLKNGVAFFLLFL